MREPVQRRILAAIRAIDAVTGAPIRDGLAIRGPGLAFQRTRSGAYVIVGASGLEAHVTSFVAPPAAPPAESVSFDFEFSDPAGRYLPAAATLRLPRRWDPANNVRDPMAPIDVPLAPSAATALAPSWAGVMVRVADQNGAPVRGALVEVFAAGGTANRLGWSVTNERGQALAAIAGLPSLREIENDPAIESDDQVVTAETQTDIRVRALTDRRWPANPAVLAAGAAGVRTANRNGVPLTPGRTDSVAVTIDLS